MSEELKCPCCGGPVQKYDDPYASTFIACNSDNDECMFVCDVNNFQRITAAMDLSRTTRTLESAMEPLNAGKVKMGDALPAIRLAMEDQKACEQRVLEVFNAK